MQLTHTFMPFVMVERNDDGSHRITIEWSDIYANTVETDTGNDVTLTVDQAEVDAATDALDAWVRETFGQFNLVVAKAVRPR